MIDDAGKVTVAINFGSMWVDVDLGGVVGFGSQWAPAPVHAIRFMMIIVISDSMMM